MGKAVPSCFAKKTTCARWRWTGSSGNVGYLPDNSIYRELQVHECYATSGPIELAASLLSGSSNSDCLAQTSAGPEVLKNPEPDFYIVGAKSYGRNSTFLIRMGLEQIRDVFTLITGNPELDLYSTCELESQAKKYMKSSAPEVVPKDLDNLWFQVSGTVCNLWCDHCFISCSPDNHSFEFLSLEQVRRSLRQSQRLGRQGVLFYRWRTVHEFKNCRHSG